MKTKEKTKLCELHQKTLEEFLPRLLEAKKKESKEEKEHRRPFISTYTRLKMEALRTLVKEVYHCRECLSRINPDGQTNHFQKTYSDLQKWVAVQLAVAQALTEALEESPSSPY
jgi:hypothetical protein